MNLILNKAEKYCFHILNKGYCNELPFHNIEHTRKVVANVKLISKELSLSDKDSELSQIAAWFHDTGFSVKYKEHEQASKIIAKEFLFNNQIDIDKICNCIDATRMPQSPTTRIAEVLCDADLFHISTEHFFIENSYLEENGKYFVI